MTPTEFRDLFPEFASQSDSRINLFLDQASLSINLGVWPPAKADVARAYLAAHLLATVGRGGTGPSGPVTSERVGDLARTYAAPAGGGSPYSSTAYGQEFERLRRSVLCSPRVVG